MTDVTDVTAESLAKQVKRLQRALLVLWLTWIVLIPVLIVLPFLLDFWIEPDIVKADIFKVPGQRAWPAAKLEGSVEGGALTLSDEQGKPRVFVGINKDGDPGLWLSDKDMKWRAVLRVSDKGPELQLLEENGETPYHTR